jgi:ribosomal protein L40E
MTRKTVGYVQLEWVCPRCETRNPGPQKFCNGCGAPQPADVEFQQPAQEKLLKDAVEIARAKAGPDVHCPYCGGRNPGTAKFCGACGGDLKEGQKRGSGRVVGAHRPGEAAPITCPACGAPNPAGAPRCAQCGSSLASPTQAPAAPAPAARRRMTLGAAGLLLVLCLGAAAVLLLLGNRSREVNAQVESVSWSLSIPILALTEIESEAWEDEIPGEAPIGSCSLEYRYTQNEPAPNATETCGTPYTVDSGSGFGEVVQDCVYEVYDEWCSYTAVDWQVVDTAVETGEDLSPTWPEVVLSEGQQEGEGEERYQVVFSTEDGPVEYELSDAAEFTQFEIGSEWVLELNALGAILAIEPAP